MMAQNRTQKSVKNVGYNFLFQFINTVLGIILRTVYIQTLGSVFLGIDTLFADVLNIFSVADLGLNTAMTHALYKPLAEKNYDLLGKLITLYRKIYYGISFFIGLIGILFTPFIRFLVSSEAQVPYLELYYIILVLNVSCSYLFIYNGLLITADQKGYINSKIAIFSNLIFYTINIICLCIFKKYLLYIIINLIATLLTNIFLNYRAKKMYPFLSTKEALPPQDKKDIFAEIRDGMLYKICGVLLNSTDNILISILVSTIAVGYYGNYNLIMNKMLLVVTIVFSAIGSSIGNVIVQENEVTRYAVFNKLQNFCLLLSNILVCVYFFLVDDIICLWIGNEYVIDKVTVIAITINFYMSIVMQPLWAFRDATALFKKTKWIMVLCAVLNIILSIVLGKAIGLAGIIFATAISKSMTYCLVEPMLLFKKYFNKNVFAYYVKIFINLIVVVISIFFVLKVNDLRNASIILKFFSVFLIPLLISIIVYFKYYIDLFKQIKEKLIEK